MFDDGIHSPEMDGANHHTIIRQPGVLPFKLSPICRNMCPDFNTLINSRTWQIQKLTVKTPLL